MCSKMAAEDNHPLPLVFPGIQPKADVDIRVYQKKTFLVFFLLFWLYIIFMLKFALLISFLLLTSENNNCVLIGGRMLQHATTNCGHERRWLRPENTEASSF